ncbi:unnamed protein product [Brassica rapa subsp. trilocularis]
MFICFFNCVLLFSCFCNFLIFNCNINEKSNKKSLTINKSI